MDRSIRIGGNSFKLMKKIKQAQRREAGVFQKARF